MTYPVFASGDVLNASDMNGVGLWLVKSHTIGAGVTESTITSCFNADFDNYRVVISGVDFSSTAGISWALRIGGNVSNYYGSSYYDQFTGTSTGTLRTNNLSFLYWGVSDQNNAGSTFDVLNPFKSLITTFMGNFYGEGFSGWAGGTHAVASPQSSLSIISPFGTMTGGTIKVYGYRN